MEENPTTELPRGLVAMLERVLRRRPAKRASESGSGAALPDEVHAPNDQGSNMEAQKRIFISVKYNHDHIVERSLTAYLKMRGYLTYLHKGTLDILKRGALPPIISQEGGLVIGMPSLPHERQMEPEPVTPELIRQLTEEICTHDLVVIVWSHPYSGSFWTMLEMKAALLARKPIVVIKTDNEKLPHNLSENDLCRVVDITPEYRTSHVASLISAMLSTSSSSESCDSVYEKLQDSTLGDYHDQHDFARFNHTVLMRYAKMVSHLRNADERGHLHDGIEELDRLGLLTDDFRKYLEFVIGGQLKAQWEDWYYTYLLGEILDIRFLHPILPPKLRVYYEVKIKDALNPPKQEKVEMLIDDMVEECLFTREFAEYFGHFLGETRRAHGRLVASVYWDLCTSRGSDLV